MTSTLDKPPALTGEPATPRRPLFTATLYLLRGVATVHALLAMIQPVSIGQYLDGRYGLLRVHQITAGLLILAGMALGLVAIGYVLAGGPVKAIGGVLLFLAEGIQTGLGYGRELGAHVPLGVAIVALALVIAVWSWTRAAGRPRPRRPRSVLMPGEAA